MSTPEETAPGAAAGEEKVRLRLSRPEDLVAALPHLLGFVPAESLVLVGLERRGARTEVGGVVRADLVDPADVATVVGACARRFGRRRPDEVVIVVVGGEAPERGGPGDPGPDGGPPRADVVDAAAAMFDASRVAVVGRVWVGRLAAGQRWCCYPPCPCRGGRLPDPHASEAAATTALRGRVTFGSRAELEELVAPSAGARSPRRAALLDAATADAVLDRELAGPAAARRDREAVAAAAREVARGGVLGDVELARVAVALLDPRVRDSCLGWSVGTADADAVSPADAEALWTLLTREVPEPEVAEAATLLAYAALARGGGALVGVALDRAGSAHPGHRLSGLLDALLAAGTDPEQVTDLIRGAAVESDARLAGDAGPEEDGPWPLEPGRRRGDAGGRDRSGVGAPRRGRGKRVGRRR